MKIGKRIGALVCTAALAAGLTCAPFAQAATGDWTSFRGDTSTNMAITNAPTPTSASDAKLLWATEPIPSSWGPEYGNYAALSPAPLLVDGYIYTAKGDTLFKVDKETGKRQAFVFGDGLDGTNPSWLAYDESVGIVLAADETTYGPAPDYTPHPRGTVWIVDPSSLKTAGAITPKCYYTFDSSELMSAPFIDKGKVYIGTRDGYIRIDPANLRSPASTIVTDCTYYWNAAVQVGGYALVGSREGKLHAIKLADGTIADTQEIDVSSTDAQSTEINSSLAYDVSSGSVYFTTNYNPKATTPGGFYKVAFDPTTGKFGAESVLHVYKSVSTPVVYKGRAYIGATTATGNEIDVIDTSTMELVYKVETADPTSSSMLLSTAGGDPRLYFTDNGFDTTTYTAGPGALYMLEDKGSSGTVTRLFTPDTTRQQACLSSPICDADGTIYYSNDSGSIFAVASQAQLDKRAAAAADAAAKKVTSITVNAKTVDAKAVASAIAKKKGDAKYVKTITLGAKVKTIKAKAFAKCTNATKLVVKTTKLKKASVKNCLKGSKIATVKVPKKKLKAYKKIFTKKVVKSAKKLKVTK